MEWLPNNRALINFFNKEVMFKPLGQPSFKFTESKAKTLPKMVSALNAKKLLSYGAM